MAGSRFAYVRSFELADALLPGTFIVARVDGRAFHRFADVQNFIKPNDERALRLMDYAARGVMEEIKDVVLAFGQSDEYSFLLRRATTIYNRRQSKILSAVTSIFTSHYLFNWPNFFGDQKMQYPPSFDGRLVLYPSETHVRDYFSWRQADTHINNLYNTAFWALVQRTGRSHAEAHAMLKGTNASQKNELLFKDFGINYSNIHPRMRKGTVLLRELQQTSQDEPGSAESTQTAGSELPKAKSKLQNVIASHHIDIIGSEFWDAHPETTSQ